MNDNDRRRLEMFERVNKFGVDNATDFPNGTIANTLFKSLVTITAQVHTDSGGQQSGFSEAAQQYEIKETAREDLRDAMSQITRTARSMEYAFDGIWNKFKWDRSMNDENLLAKARAFVIEATPYQADFIAYGMPATFITDLTALADALEASFTSAAGAVAEHVAATAAAAANVSAGMDIVRQLTGIVKNKYVNNPGLLAAWVSASHVEKPPKKKPEPPVV
ncbi:MAG: hypothetical protein IT172_11465 [Acidobacteria bacterium]|nr:hypothetical protein [Acidobacteriota bacterium]